MERKRDFIFPAVDTGAFVVIFIVITKATLRITGNSFYRKNGRKC